MEKGLGQAGSKRWAWFAIASVVGALGVFLTAGTASAQTCQPGDPGYPNCPPPGSTAPSPNIATDKSTYTEGSQVLVRACGYTAGSGAPGNITYRGTNKIAVKEGGDGCMVPSGNAAPAAGELAAPAGWIAIPAQGSFPSGSFTATPVGSGDVCSVAPGFSTPCTGIAITGVEGSRGGGGGGGLGKTGFELALYLAIALILLVIGANLVQWSRRRRRHLARARATAHVEAQRERERQLTH